MKHYFRFLILAFLLISAALSFTACDNLSVEETDSESSTGSSNTAGTKGSGTSSTGSSTDTSATATDSGTDSESSGRESSGTSSSEDYTAENCALWDYKVSSPIYALSSDVTKLVISGTCKNQTLYLAKTNPTAKSISASKTQYISSAENLTLYTTESDTDSETESGSGTGTASFPTPGSHGGPGRRHFIPASFSELQISDYSAERSATSSFETDTAVEQITPIEGETRKEIYIDADTEMSSYRAAEATLQAAGKYCYIWLVDGFEDISQSVFTEMAEKFDEIYQMIRNVFGNESDEIYYRYSNGSFSTAPMNYLSDTGSMVNIVVYDIGADHSDNDSTGVLGYFYAKDYYPDGSHITSLGGSYQGDVRKYSNEGKYFYIDAYYLQSQPQMMYSTIAHEFQHMINWGVKYMEQDIDCSTGFNEMLSMLCEDMMQEYLGISDSDSPKGRLPMFEQCYADCGLEYRSSSSYLQILSYSSNYAFGSWIARQFGGAKVISEMSKNGYTDTEAIREAVNKVNGTSYTMEELLKMYSAACLVLPDSTDTYDWPTFYKETSLSESDNLYYTAENINYSYPLTSINLWTLKESLADFYALVEESSASSYYKFDGPQLYGCNVQKEIRPYGMTLVKAGLVTEDDEEVTINFGISSPSVDEKVYVIIR